MKIRTQTALTRKHQRKYLGSSTYSLVYCPELPQPTVIVQKLAVVKTVIIGRVSLSMVSRRHYGHLVTVDTVEPEEKLDLLCNLKMMIITNMQNKDNRTNFFDSKYSNSKLFNHFELRRNSFANYGINNKKISLLWTLN